MGLLERIEARRRGEHSRKYPVGMGAIDRFATSHGHDQTQFSPEEYGDYIATSNEVFSAVSLRARLMSGLDLSLYRGRGQDKREISTGPVANLLRYVNPFWSAERLARMDEMSMGLWGQSFWAVEKHDGKPVEIWWMKASRVKPVPHETNYLKGFLYEPINGGEPVPFRTDEVVWFRYPNPVDEFSSLSPLAAARLSADTASDMMKANRNLFTNGMQPGGVIVPATDKVVFSKEQAADLEELFESRMKGVSRAHRWAVLRFEAQLKSLAVSPKDAEFVNGLNLTLRQVCNAYGIPSPLLNDMEHATLANAREFERMLWSHALVPDAKLRAGDIREQFLPMFRGGPDHCEYDFTQVAALQESASEAWGREAQALERGALTINEWRKSKGMPPVPWGDVWWAPVNKSAVQDADSMPQGDTAPAPVPNEEADPVVLDVPAKEADDERTWRPLLDALETKMRLNGHARSSL